ncbi:MAG: cell surface protein SprA, partial [Gemmatimonadota bacterium]
MAAPADTASIPGLPVGLTRVPYVWRIDLSSALIVARPNSRRLGQPAREWLAHRTEVQDHRLAAQRDTLWMVFLPVDKLPPDFDTRRFFDAPVAAEDELADRQPEGIRLVPDALAELADLDILIEGTGQIGTQWQSFDPCTLGTGQQCNSNAVPSVRPEFQLRALVKGTISDRVNLDVDFDQTREFDATNNLNVYYEGKPGEIVEFVELGEVTLPLPPSRFISRAIPAGNFGIRTRARFGPLQVRAVLAEQDGSVETRRLTLDVGGGQEGVLQDFEAIIDDASYADGQFFFVVDPREFPAYPHIDVTSLNGTEVPLTLQPGSALKLYRHEVQTGQPQNVEDGIIQARAVAVRPAAADPSLPDSAEFQGFFRPLAEGEDYIVHDSGLWIVMKSRILENEALAVTYIAASGDTIGDFNAEEIFRDIANTGSGVLPQLGLLKDTETHRPGGITWEREMHQVYRVSSSDDVESGSIGLTISQGPIESGPIVRQSGGEDFAFLEIFGLDDTPNDDRVDDARIWRPATSGGLGVVTGSYLVFPTLQPFLDPPPILSLGAPFPLASSDQNADIYQEPIDLIRASSFRYRLNFEYRARSSGQASSFSLGAIGIREASERVTLDGRELERGRDYTIDYEIGQLQILRPGELFGGAQNPDLEVRFEQKPIFQVQPTSIVGLTGQYSLGEIGSIDFAGLLQREGSVLNRPELGLEPSAISLGGVMANLDFESGLLDRFVNSLPGVSTAIPSRIRFDGEIAGSSPTTNRNGLTFIDDFEGTSRLALGLSNRSWRNGSVTSRPDATAGFMPFLPDLSNQLTGVWQSQWIEGQLIQGPLLTLQVDPALRVRRAGSSESVLWVSLQDAPVGENGWFTLTQPLSETGLDLTAVEFLEFYASTLGETAAGLSMIIDLGSVSEDALVADPLGLPAGVGDLDQEADPLVGVWGNQNPVMWGFPII